MVRLNELLMTRPSFNQRIPFTGGLASTKQGNVTEAPRSTFSGLIEPRLIRGASVHLLVRLVVEKLVQSSFASMAREAIQRNRMLLQR